MGIPTEFKSFGDRKIPLTLMEATFDYPYLKDESNGFEIISLPYEHDGMQTKVSLLVDNFFLLFLVRNEEISEAHMFLILPSHEGQEEFEKLEKTLLTLDFPDIFDRMGVVFGDVLLPRMELKFSTNLGSYFSQIGKVS